MIDGLPEFRVVVVGSAQWVSEDRIRSRLRRLPRHAHIAHGGTRGAETIADRIARELGLRVTPYPVDPELDGPWPAAGHMRNLRMLETHKPRLVIVFRVTSGSSPGTDRCLKWARRWQIRSEVVRGA